MQYMPQSWKAIQNVTQDTESGEKPWKLNYAGWKKYKIFVQITDMVKGPTSCSESY